MDLPNQRRQRKGAFDRQGYLKLYDHGSRDPGLHGLGELLQPSEYNKIACFSPQKAAGSRELNIFSHAIQVGLDHVVLVKLASASVVSKLLGLDRAQTIDVISQVFVDGQSLRTYRHAPNTGSRKSWAAGDACSRAVNLALLVKRGEMGIPTVLTAKTWGFYDVLFGGKPFEFQRPYGSYIMENILFKVGFDIVYEIFGFIGLTSFLATDLLPR